MKIHAKITIIVVENREPYYFVIIGKCKQGPLRLFSYQMLASTLTMDDRSISYMSMVHGHIRLASLCLSLNMIGF